MVMAILVALLLTAMQGLYHLHSYCFECREHAFISEGNPAKTNTGGIVNCVSNCRNQWFAYGLAGSVVRQIRTARIGITVD